MVQIIEENRPKSKAEMFSQAFGALGQTGAQAVSQHFAQKEQQKAQQMQMQAENEQIQALSGMDISGIQDPKMRQQIVAEALKGRSAESHKKAGLETSVNALNKLKSMVGQKGIGLSGAINPSAEARHNRGEFQSLQSALMPLFKSMFPRGMTEKEFKFVNENYIPQVHDSEETILGKIQGLEQLLGMNSGELGMPEQGQPSERGKGFDVSQTSVNKGKERKRISSFYR